MSPRWALFCHHVSTNSSYMLGLCIAWNSLCICVCMWFFKVMLVIDAAVSHLDDLHSLEDFLLNLGRKHQAVGVNTQSFAVGQHFITQLQKAITRVNELWQNIAWKLYRVCFLGVFGFQVVGESLLYMLQSSLGQAYTGPLRQAWLNMYSIVVAAMSRGWAKNGEGKADWGAQGGAAEQLLSNHSTWLPWNKVV